MKVHSGISGPQRLLKISAFDTHHGRAFTLDVVSNFITAAQLSPLFWWPSYFCFLVALILLVAPFVFILLILYHMLRGFPQICLHVRNFTSIFACTSTKCFQAYLRSVFTLFQALHRLLRVFRAFNQPGPRAPACKIH